MIVDADSGSRERMKSFIKRIGNSILVAEEGAAIPATPLLRDSEVDLLFLDMHLPDLKGVDWVASFQDPPEIVFISENREDALGAFDADALDFLLKPFGFDRFLKSVNRYFERVSPETAGLACAEHIPSNAIIQVEEPGMTHRIAVSEICFVEAVNGQLRIQTESLPLMIRNTMDRLTSILAPWPFLRINQDLLVSISKIRSFSPTKVDLHHSSFHIGRNYQEQVWRVLHGE